MKPQQASNQQPTPVPHTCNAMIPKLTAVSAASVAMLSSRCHMFGHPTGFRPASIGGDPIASDGEVDVFFDFVKDHDDQQLALRVCLPCVSLHFDRE